MFPALYSSVHASGALRFEGTGFAVGAPVSNQSLAMLHGSKALYQCLSCRALIFILIGVVDKGILINLQGLVAVPSAL